MATTCRLRPRPSSHYTHSSHSSGLEAWLSLESKVQTVEHRFHKHTTARLGLKEIPQSRPLPIRGHPDSRVTQTAAYRLIFAAHAHHKPEKPRKQNSSLSCKRRMIEVRNPSKPRDAANAANDTSLRVFPPHTPDLVVVITLYHPPKKPFCGPAPDAITLYPRARPHTPTSPRNG